jgi:DNA-binding Xre family transcriptional regulator
MMRPREAKPFTRLNAICGALSCQRGDILRFEPDAEPQPVEAA